MNIEEQKIKLNKLEIIYKQHAKYNRSLVDEIVKLKFQIAEPNYQSKIGKCYTYVNSYGTGKDWLLYMKIISYDEDSYTVFSFEKDCYGEITINPLKIENHSFYLEERRFNKKNEVTNQVFIKSYQRLLEEINIKF